MSEVKKGSFMWDHLITVLLLLISNIFWMFQYQSIRKYKNEAYDLAASSIVQTKEAQAGWEECLSIRGQQ